MKETVAASSSVTEKLERGDLLDPHCASRDILQHVTSRWGTLILLVLLRDTMRFGQLRRAIGDVSERMLAQTLQVLEADGIVVRRALDVIPPHVEYSLSALGREAAVNVRALADWVELNAADIEAQRPNQGVILQE
ncbi:HxlR family transcriptional regulator protein [Rhizobium sp. CIAT894]|uniref:winged helix-turn-helix transcriptional regulator n=1 Tax=Rhizobium sp. CIAT894 TaxID=2020312 RepID=UPI000A1E8FD3|nr:helix-turn-helix domain-containing protein [Rhizobium sp. CIAT894]ARM88138.1 HxlR family transcriptional regulator protein [Rhizobium sp. CIAT894]